MPNQGSAERSSPMRGLLTFNRLCMSAMAIGAVVAGVSGFSYGNHSETARLEIADCDRQYSPPAPEYQKCLDAANPEIEHLRDGIFGAAGLAISAVGTITFMRRLEKNKNPRSNANGTSAE